MKTVVSMTTPTTEEYTTFVERHSAIFADFGIDRMKRYAVAKLVYDMCHTVVDDPVEAELHAIAKVSMLLAEIRHSLSPTEDYLERPMERLRPFLISGAEERQRPWIELLNLIQLRNWHRKGVGDYSAEIAELENRLAPLSRYGEVETLDGWG